MPKYHNQVALMIGEDGILYIAIGWHDPMEYESLRDPLGWKVSIEPNAYDDAPHLVVVRKHDYEAARTALDLTQVPGTVERVREFRHCHLLTKPNPILSRAMHSQKGGTVEGVPTYGQGWPNVPLEVRI